MSSVAQASRSGRIGTPASRLQFSDRSTGLLLACLVPALFWTAMIALVGNALGAMPAVATLALIALGIAAFLVIVVGSLTARG